MFGSASPAHSGASATQEGQALVKGVSKNTNGMTRHTPSFPKQFGVRSAPRFRQEINPCRETGGDIAECGGKGKGRGRSSEANLRSTQIGLAGHLSQFFLDTIHQGYESYVVRYGSIIINIDLYTFGLYRSHPFFQSDRLYSLIWKWAAFPTYREMLEWHPA
jgi:hypothetical protein